MSFYKTSSQVLNYVTEVQHEQSINTVHGINLQNFTEKLTIGHRSIYLSCRAFFLHLVRSYGRGQVSG